MTPTLVLSSSASVEGERPRKGQEEQDSVGPGYGEEAGGTLSNSGRRTFSMTFLVPEAAAASVVKCPVPSGARLAMTSYVHPLVKVHHGGDAPTSRLRRPTTFL